MSVAALACSAKTSPNLSALPEPAVEADSTRVTTIAPGVKHRYYWIARGPWAVNVLDVDRASCWSPVALKGSQQAGGRTRTTTLFEMHSAVSQVNRTVFVAGAVNADFFSLSTGAPVGPHVHLGNIISGPVERPAFGIDTSGTPFIGSLSLAATVRRGAESTLVRLNRPLGSDISIFNGRWATRTDTATGAVEVGLRRLRSASDTGRPRALPDRDGPFRAVVAFVDTASAGVALPTGGSLIVAGARADSARRAWLSRLAVGDTISVSYAWTGVQPLEAVGGFPMLLRAGLVAPEIETAGSAGFRGRHPRTAVGLAANGRRMLFVTVDGRQPPYSDGMTLTELADLMKRLGAGDALNLDGGGSTAMVLSDSTARPKLRIANRPSDKEGERPVGNAIAIENSCRERK